MASIETWLSGDRNYEAGLQLLREHGASDFMIDLLADGPDEYNTPKLLQEILALHILPQPATASQPSPGNGSGSNSREDAQWWSVAPTTTYLPDHDLEKTIRIKEQIKQLYKEIGHLKPQLIHLPTRLQRYQCATDIATKDLRRQDLWEHLHYFEENGKWFDELPENQPKPFDLERAIKNEMANRSKASAFLDKPQTVVKKAYYEEKVAGHTRKIENLKKLRPNG